MISTNVKFCDKFEYIKVKFNCVNNEKHMLRLQYYLLLCPNLNIL